MNPSRFRLLGMLVLSLSCNSESSDMFTSIGNSQVLFMNEELVFAEAERRCREKDSILAEIWSEDEWKEVSISYL